MKRIANPFLEMEMEAGKYGRADYLTAGELCAWAGVDLDTVDQVFGRHETAPRYLIINGESVRVILKEEVEQRKATKD